MDFTNLTTQMSLMSTIVASVIAWVIMAIPTWKLMEKAGEAGWKGIIPIYNEYMLYKISWKVAVFWVLFILTIASSVLLGMVSAVPSVIGMILLIAVSVIEIIAQVKLAKAFGKGGGFAVGLIFLNVIFMYILAFGSAEYKGNQ